MHLFWGYQMVVVQMAIIRHLENAEIDYDHIKQVHVNYYSFMAEIDV